LSGAAPVDHMIPPLDPGTMAMAPLLFSSPSTPSVGSSAVPLIPPAPLWVPGLRDFTGGLDQSGYVGVPQDNSSLPVVYGPEVFVDGQGMLTADPGMPFSAGGMGSPYAADLAYAPSAYRYA
jgi:hypothetical protein